MLKLTIKPVKYFVYFFLKFSITIILKPINKEKFSCYYEVKINLMYILNKYQIKI